MSPIFIDIEGAKAGQHPGNCLQDHTPSFDFILGIPWLVWSENIILSACFPQIYFIMKLKETQY